MRGRPNSVARVFDSVRSRIPTIALWPDWVTRGVVNPRDTLAVGFMPAPPRLGSFGPAPVGSLQDTKLAVFVAGTIGTTAGWFDSFVRVSGAACRAVGCRGVILGGDCAEPPVGLADCVVWRPFWPLAQVLPYADVLVHHGGIGTAARALEHGVPQLIVLRVFAQASNAEWLRALGVCSVMDPRVYSVAAVSDHLCQLLSQVEYQRAAARAARRCDSEVSLARIGHLLEAWRDRPAPGRLPSGSIRRGMAHRAT